MSCGTWSRNGSECSDSLLTMRLLTAMVLAAAVTSCSAGSGSSAEHRSQPPLPTLSQTTPPARPSATPAATTTTRAARRIPALDGDVDGDGVVDSLRTSGGRLTVELSSTQTSVSAPVHRDEPGDAGLLGSRDVDRDGFAEVFLETASGASTTFTTPYRYDGKALRELQLDAGPVRLGIGGSVTHGDGFSCLDSGRLEVRSADSQDGSAFTVHVSVYRLSPTELVLISSSTTRGKQGDPAVESSYQVRCGSVGDGG